MKPKLALVEADLHLRRQLFWALAESYELIEAGDGPSALEALGSRPQGAIVNPYLPPQEGWEGGRRLIEAGRRMMPELKWVLLAGGAEEEAALRAMLSPDASLVKPFRLEELWGELRRVLPAPAGPGREKRVHPRVRASLPVVYIGLGNGAECPARGVGFTRDLARGGAMFSTELALDPMSLLRLWLFLSPAAQPVERVGQVRWVAPQCGGDLFDVGVRFEAIEAKREGDLARVAAQAPAV